MKEPEKPQTDDSPTPLEKKAKALDKAMIEFELYLAENGGILFMGVGLLLFLFPQLIVLLLVFGFWLLVVLALGGAFISFLTFLTR